MKGRKVICALLKNTIRQVMRIIKPVGSIDTSNQNFWASELHTL